MSRICKNSRRLIRDACPTALREQVRAVDPDLPLFEVMTLNDLLAASDERVGLRVFGTMRLDPAAVLRYE